MTINVKLKKRLQRKNTKHRKADYWPRAVAAHRKLEPGTRVYCIEDAVGTKPKMVRVIRADDIGDREVESFVVLLEDLTE